MILSEQDSGHTINVAVGSIITVRLKEMPTTGYRWIVEAADGLEQVSSRFQEAGAAIGAAGVREIQFRATSVGTHELRMQNRRDWEGAGSAVEEFVATMIVKKA